VAHPKKYLGKRAIPETDYSRQSKRSPENSNCLFKVSKSMLKKKERKIVAYLSAPFKIISNL